MEEETWFTKQKSQMDDEFWKLKQRARLLQDCRKELRGIWQDDAAFEINKRYFQPHEEDSQELFSKLSQQLEALQNADEELAKASHHGVEVNKLLEDAEKFREFAQQDIKRAYSAYSTFQDQNSAARADLPAISQLINQANSCCP